MLRAMVVVCAATGIGDAEPARVGTYVLKLLQFGVPKVEGKPLPSCGDAARAELSALVPVTAKHDNSDVVLVNGQRWKYIEEDGHSFARKPMTEDSNGVVALLFENRGAGARGALTFVRRDGANRIVCIDSVLVIGSYKRR